MKRNLWRALIVLLALLILWAWLSTDDAIAEHKSMIEHHRIERDKGAQSEFFLKRKNRMSAKEYLV